MKHLQNIIQESLLDDFDILSNNIDKYVINKSINDPESKLWQLFDLDRREVGSRFPLKYEDRTLYIPRTLVQQNQSNRSIESVVGFPVDNLVVSGGLYIGKHFHEDEITGSNFCKKIYCGAGVKIHAELIKDIEITIGNIGRYKTFPSSINSIVFDDVKLLDNVKINFDSRWKGINFHQYDSLPMIKNCDMKGCKIISIYSPFLFDKEVSDLITSKWMIPNFEHDYNYGDLVKIKNFKKMVAIVNNPKKYGDNTPKAFKNDINASDVIPWINDIDITLEQVTLSSNNVRLVLSKGPKYDSSINRSYVTYTKDGWNITMYKK